MKIYLLRKKSIVLYSCLVLCAIGILILGNSGVASVFNDTADDRLLPIYSVDRGEEKVCALTFDAAWDDLDTDILIEILNRYDVKATFFLVGSWVAKYPESVKKFADNGHEIANHTDSHPHIAQLSEEKIKEEITKCADKIESVTGKRSTLFRGPYGEYSNSAIQAADALSHKTIQWDVDSLDWKDLAADDIVTRVVKRVQPGSIMLFHNGAKNTPEALPQVIEKLQTDGYRFVTVSELIYHDNYIIDPSGKQIPGGADKEEPSDAPESDQIPVETTIPETAVPPASDSAATPAADSEPSQAEDVAPEADVSSDASLEASLRQLIGYRRILAYI